LGERAVLLDMDEGQHSSLNWGKRRGGKPPTVLAMSALKLAPTLTALRDEGAAWAFIDLPGRDAPAANAGVIIADFILIPSRPATLDFEASLATVQAAVRARKRYAYLLSIVLAGGDKARAKRFAEELQGMGQTVCPVIIGQRVAVADAIGQGRAACETAPKSESAREFAALLEWLKEEVK
jgi:chromosome partitioning protein